MHREAVVATRQAQHQIVAGARQREISRRNAGTELHRVDRRHRRLAIPAVRGIDRVVARADAEDIAVRAVATPVS